MKPPSHHKLDRQSRYQRSTEPDLTPLIAAAATTAGYSNAIQHNQEPQSETKTDVLSNLDLSTNKPTTQTYEYRLNSENRSSKANEILSLINDDNFYKWNDDFNQNFRHALYYPLHEKNGFAVPPYSVSMFINKLDKSKRKEQRNGPCNIFQDPAINQELYDTTLTDWKHPFMVLRLVSSSKGFAKQHNSRVLADSAINLKVQIRDPEDGKLYTENRKSDWVMMMVYYPPNWKLLSSVKRYLKNESISTDELLSLEENKSIGINPQLESDWNDIIDDLFELKENRTICCGDLDQSLTMRDIFGRVSQSNPAKCVAYQSLVKDAAASNKTADDVDLMKGSFKFGGLMLIPEEAMMKTKGAGLFHFHPQQKEFYESFVQGTAIVVEESHPCFRDLLDSDTLEMIGDEWKVTQFIANHKKSSQFAKRKNKKRNRKRLMRNHTGKTTEKNKCRRITEKNQPRGARVIPDVMKHWLLRLYRILKDSKYCPTCVLSSCRGIHKTFGKHFIKLGLDDPNITCTYDSTKLNPWLVDHPLRSGVFRRSLNFLDELYYPQERRTFALSEVKTKAKIVELFKNQSKKVWDPLSLNKTEVDDDDLNEADGQDQDGLEGENRIDTEVNKISKSTVKSGKKWNDVSKNLDRDLQKQQQTNAKLVEKTLDKMLKEKSSRLNDALIMQEKLRLNKGDEEDEEGDEDN